MPNVTLAEHFFNEPYLKFRLPAPSAAVAKTPPLTRICKQQFLFARRAAHAHKTYPPVWGLSRTPIEDDELGGYFVPKNSIVIVSPFVSHRNSKYWPEPERFIPERFREFEKKPFVYFPFGFGRRACIGASLAIYEVMIVIAKILRRFDLSCDEADGVEPRALVTIKPSVPVNVRWRERRL